MMRAVFREVWRVLRDDGSCWVNIGDSYANDGKWGGETGGMQAYLDDNSRKRVGREKRQTGLPPKSLMLIPQRLALALQADGWTIRNDIIWMKGNPMPESVKDRCTVQHEYIWLLVKQRRYYFDADAIRTPLKPKTYTTYGAPVHKLEGDGTRKVKQVNWHESITERKPRLSANGTPAGANKRTVWQINTRPHPFAHFAVFPEELPATCIQAGTSEAGVCPHCGEPWYRVTERADYPTGTGNMGAKGAKWQQRDEQSSGHRIQRNLNALRAAGYPHDNPYPPRETLGWRPNCSCYDRLYWRDYPQARSARKRRQRQMSGDWFKRVRRQPGLPHWPIEAALVLDPFAGSGTTSVAAKNQDRRSVGVDLSFAYLRHIALERTRLEFRPIPAPDADLGPLFTYQEEEITDEK
jgi:DNA modification methylase